MGLGMSRISELFELARQSYGLANSTTHPETKRFLQDVAAKYEQEADALRCIESSRAPIANDKM
jgi:hypothetical protein